MPLKSIKSNQTKNIEQILINNNFPNHIVDGQIKNVMKRKL